jgi:hypothetical protein
MFKLFRASCVYTALFMSFFIDVSIAETRNFFEEWLRDGRQLYLPVSDN